MQSASYCKPCYAAVAAEELPEDTARLHELDHYWAMRVDLKHKQAVCARCGYSGDVVYHETTG